MQKSCKKYFLNSDFKSAQGAYYAEYVNRFNDKFVLKHCWYGRCKNFEKIK